ncbi:MAG: type I restriction endonuclease subunit R [Bacteroidales bacterium]|nr:type I restriction endonuclease subunit R [Bacteroidales bacterium]
MANYISEDDIEKRAIQMFLEELHYDGHICCLTKDEKNLNDGSNRSGKEEVVLADHLRSAMVRINRKAPDAAIDQAINELVKGRSGMSLMSANKEVYELIREKYTAKIINKKGREEPVKIQYIDFNNPDKNEFLVVSQLWIKGMPKFRRPDLLIYINGIPLVFIELKNSNIEVKSAYDHNLKIYLEEIPQLFVYNAITILSNAVETKLGAFQADYEKFFEWLREDESKEIDRERIKKYNVSLEYALRGLLKKETLLDYIENFILYHVKSAFKIIAKNHQYIGVNKTIESFHNREAKDGKLGVFWHTQGSGKSFSMIMFAQKVFRKFNGDFTFFIVTDRDNLDGQIYRNFLNMGAVGEKEEVRPKSGKQLREYLSGNKRYVFSLIHKFRYPKGKKYPLLSDRPDIVALVDEAHRTQYKDLAENMRIAIPNAQYIAFTGTPLLGSKRLTNRFFGDYVSEYNFRHSYEDGSTVPLFYDKRVPEVQMINDDLNTELAEVIDEEELSESQAGRLEREFASELSVIRNEDRLRKIAKDVVKHFTRRGYKGRGMVVSIDKFTTVKMYDLVQQYWKEEIIELRKKRKFSKNEDEKEELDQLIDYMNWVEMAVVISHDNTDDEKKAFEAKGFNITPHIKKMQHVDENGHDLEFRFQEIPSDPFQLVFVCAMWLTGFDSETLSDMYLDKPMIGHTLMQTIARVNRVSAGKKCGRIIDYYGVFRNLKKALADYATIEEEIDEEELKPGNLPVEEKEKLFELLHAAIKEAEDYCYPIEINLKEILEIPDTFKNIARFESYADKILSSEDHKKNFFVYSNTVESLYEACKPDIYERKEEFEILDVIRYLRKIVDRKKFTGDLESARAKYAEIIDQSISTVDETFTISKSRTVDISKFDFDKLREKFKKADYKHIEIEDLKMFIEDKLQKLISDNITRTDFAEKLERIIDEYNSGSLSVENYFEELVEFSKKLKTEEERHIRENLEPDELEIFDLLRKTNKNLTRKDEQLVKLAARDLLKKLKEVKEQLFVADWYRDEVSRLTVMSFVRDNLNQNLPNSYLQGIFENTCKIIVDHLQRLSETGGKWAA